MTCRHTSTMIVTGCAILLNITVGTASVEAKQDVRQDSLLSVIESLYESGSYLTAELEARRFLEQSIDRDTFRIEAEKYLAFSLIAQGKNQSAIQHFRIILEIDSTFELDPLLTSPKILAAYHETRAAFFSKHRRSEEISSQTNILSPVSITYRTIVFPGWEQLHQERTITGYTFLGAGVAALASTVFCDIRRRDLRTSYLNATTSIEATKRYDRYNRYYKAEIYSAISFAAIYLLSEVDVFLNQSQVISLSTGVGKSLELKLALTF